MFQRRLKIIIFFWAAAAGVLVVRLGRLQIIEGGDYVRQTQQTIERAEWIDTRRGRILDCRDRALALDEGSYELCLHYKLTRLYDDRFWRFQQYKAEDNPAKDSGERQELAEARERAEELLADLVRICAIEPEELYGPIREINDTIYVWRSSRARRRYYDKTGLPYRGATARGIEEDLTEKIPAESERLVDWIFHSSSDVAEMNMLHRVLTISEDEALIVEEKIIGASPRGDGQERAVSIRTGKLRRYPYEDAACHLIGQLIRAPADPNRPEASGAAVEEPDEQQSRAYQLGDRRGEWGVERMFEERLRGRRGWIKYNKNYEPMRQIDIQLGQDVRLTIDIELHQKILNFFEGNNGQRAEYQGAAVVIDVPTGEIRALVSAPTFDLNSYYRRDQYERINPPDKNYPDPLRRKVNRALSENYMPGSTIKPTLLLKALEAGVVEAQSRISCTPGSAAVTPRSICHLYGHGMVDARQAIKVSCNTYFMEAAQRIGAQAVTSWLAEMGFGRHLLAWPEGVSDQRAYYSFQEAAGYLQRRIPYEQDLSFISVGLRPLEGSVLQLANSMATLAREGIFKQPFLILEPKVRQEQYRVADSLGNIRTVQAGMQAVIYEAGGTAYNAFTTWPWGRDQISLYGKTGSTGDCSVFSGFARGGEGSSLALAVVVEDEGGGGTVAAPLGRRIWQACAELGYLGVGVRSR